MAKQLSIPLVPLSARDELWSSCETEVGRFRSAQRLWESFFREEDRQRLGGNLVAAYRRHGTAGLWKIVRDGSPRSALLEVGRRLEILTEAEYRRFIGERGEAKLSFDPTLRAARAAGHLILVESSTVVLWEGKVVDVDWDRFPKLWDYFWQLCACGKEGTPLESQRISAEASRRNLASWKSRLIRQPVFPTSLAARMEVTGDRHQLLLAPEQILFWRANAPETVLMLSPARQV